MRQPTATADQIVYLIRRHVVPRPPENNIDPVRDRRLSLTTIGHLLKNEYNALPTAVPPHLAVLIDQLKMQK
jgi:hypothetical protein